MAEEITTSPEESVSMEAPIVESPVDIQEEVVDVTPTPPKNTKGVENFKMLHEILAADEVYSQIVPSDLKQFVSKYSDPTKLKMLHEILSADEVYSQIMPADINVAADKYGFGGLGKPSAVPSPSVSGGSATKEIQVEEPSTPQPRSVESKPPSSLQKNKLNGLRVPKYLYGMKAESFQDPKIIRYTLTKLGINMSEFTSDDVAKVLESDYTNAGDMVEDIAQTVFDRKANPEPVQPQEEERLKQSFVTVKTKKPLVVAPEKFEDLYGFKKAVAGMVERSKDKQPNSSSLLSSYERDQQTAIDINKKIRNNSSRINDLEHSTSAMTHGGGLDYAQINKLKAENEQLEKAQYKQTNIANQSLAKAQPILDKYVDGLTDGLKFNQFLRDDGTLRTDVINDAAVKIAEQSGLSDEGVVVKYVEGLIGSRAKVNLAQPAALGIFEADRQKILDKYKLEKKQVEEAYKAPINIENQAKLNIKAVEEEIVVFKKREDDLAEENYKTIINQNRIQYDANQTEYARQIEEQRQLVSQNQLQPNVADANIKAILAKSEEETDAINKQNLEQFNQLQAQFNQNGTKYNNQYKRRQQEIYDASNKLIQKDFEKYVKQVGFDKKTEKVNEELKTAYSKAWDLALKNIDDQKIAKTERLRNEAGFFNLIKGVSGSTLGKNATLELAYTTFNNSLGSSIEALGDGMGIDYMRVKGKQLKDANNLLSPAKVQSWSDLLDFGNLVQLSSQLGGSMAPSIIATTALTYATGGAGLGIGAQMVAGAYAGWLVESTDMSSRLYLDTVSRTGNAVLGQERADKMWDFQKKMMWTYSLSALPYISGFWKGVKVFSKSPRLAAASKIAMGGSAEYFEEAVLQEYPQGIGEEAIMSNRDAITAVGEQIARVTQYLTGDGVYASEKEKEDVEGAAQRFKENAITTAPTFGFGAAGAARGVRKESIERADIKKQGLAYYQKFILSDSAPHIAEQQIRRLAMTKGAAFTGTMVSNLFADGSINEEQRDKLLTTIDKTKTYVSNAKQQKLKAEDAALYMTLADIHESAQAEADAAEDPILKEASQKKADVIKKELTDFLVTKETNLLGITLADGESYIVTIDDLNTMIEDNSDLIGDMADGNFKVQSLGNNTTKLQQDAIESLGQQIEEYKANAVAQQAEQESKVKTLADDIEVGDTVDLTPSAQPTTEEAPQAEATTEENVGNVEFNSDAVEFINERRDKLLSDIEYYKQIIEEYKPKTIRGKLANALIYKKSEYLGGFKEALSEAEAELNELDANPIEYFKRKKENNSDEATKQYFQDSIDYLEQNRITPQAQTAPLFEAPTIEAPTQEQEAAPQTLPEVENAISNLREQDQAENQVSIENRNRKDLFPDTISFSNNISFGVLKLLPDSKISSYREVNGAGVAEYTNPKTGLVDVIMTGTSDNDFVGYIRIYEKQLVNGSTTVVPTNRWTSKMENKSGNKANFKTMINEVKSSLPEGHEYTEKTNISLDGLRVFAKNLQKGYEYLRDKAGNIVTNNVELNNATLEKLRGAKTEEEVRELYERKKGITREEFNKIKEKVESILPNTQLIFNQTDGSVIVRLPVLVSTPTTEAQAPVAEEVKDEVTAIEPKIILSGLNDGFQAVSYESFDPRSDRGVMDEIQNGRSFVKIVEQRNGKRYIVVGVTLSPESRREARTNGRDNYSFAVAELNESTPSDIVKTLENSAKENFKNIYRDFSDKDFVIPINESAKSEVTNQLTPTTAATPTSEQAPESFPAQEGAESEQKKDGVSAELEQIYRDLHKSVMANVDKDTIRMLKEKPTEAMVDKALRELQKKRIIQIEC